MTSLESLLEVLVHIPTLAPRRAPRPALLPLLLCLLVASCGKDATAPQPPGNGTGTPPANPDGVLLDGVPGDTGFARLETLPPSAVDEADIAGDLLTTRLVAILNPHATVGQINGALEAHHARIVAMDPGNVVVTLVIPPVTTAAEARALADALVASEAFFFASPARVARPREGTIGAGDERSADHLRELPPSGDTGVEHLTSLRMPAAWNAKRLATQNGNRVTVVVPDYYDSSNPHPQITAQTFVAGNGNASPGDNHGYNCAGIIGADYDDAGPTGTSPAPQQLLAIQSVHVAGLPNVDWVREIAQRVPATGNFVLSTSLGFIEEPVLTKDILVQRAFAGLAWRMHAHPNYDRFFHATAAGNEGSQAGPAGDAHYASEFAIAHYWNDIRDMIPADSLTTEEWENLDLAWDAMLQASPGASGPSPNCLVVGSSGPFGAEAAYSNRRSEVRAVGEDVFAPCAVQEPEHPGDPDACDGNVERSSGTSMATPAVAGLAAYLWNLDPTLTTEEIARRIQHAYDVSPTPGLIDAYAAVLSLDTSLSNPRVRMSILDVAGGTPESPPNGVLDENDLVAFLTFFEHYELIREQGNTDPDHSRYDLNGDGYTGEDTDSKLDLDANDPPSFGTVSRSIEGASISFDENSVTDLDVLCYYAYTDLYTGDHDERRERLAEVCGDPSVELRILPHFWDEDISWGEDVKVGIRAVYWDGQGDPAPVEGASVTFTVSGGSLDAASGTTSTEGIFGTMGRIDLEADSLRVEVHVDDGNGQTADTILRAGAQRGEVGPPLHNGTYFSVQAGATVGSDTCDQAFTHDPDENDFSSFSVSEVVTCSASEPDCGTMTVTAEGSLSLEIETDPETGGLLAITAQGTGATLLTGGAGDCGGGNRQTARVIVEIRFEIAGDDVPVRLTGEFDPPENGTMGVSFGIWQDALTEPVSLEAVDTLGPGTHTVHVDLNGANGTGNGGSFDFEFRLFP